MSEAKNPKKMQVEQDAGNPADKESIKTKRNILVTIRHNPLFMGGLIVFILAAVIIGFLYWSTMQSRIYIEKSEIYAPVISLSPDTPGTINEIYIKEGDVIAKDQALAKVGTHLVTSKTSGLITWVGNTPGQMANAQAVVVKMIDLASLRVIGHIDEDKGLSEIQVGQKVIFTVDAFGAKEYIGEVESIGASANQASIVFSISDKRAEKPFDITVKYDGSAYPELKNGMSARMWIYK
jgi:multidrug resistance efflux pump